MKTHTDNFRLELRQEGFDISQFDSGEVKKRCPKCSDSRKKSYEKCCAVNVDEGVWYCHHCSWKGSINNQSDTTMNQKNNGSFEVVSAEVPSTPDVQTLGNEDSHLHSSVPEEIAQDIESNRAIKVSVLEDFDIRFGDRSIQFPYFKNGELVNVKTRMSGKRFRLVPDADLLLYNIDSIEEGEDVVITEGEFDVLAAKSAGVNIPVTSVPNGANIHNNNLSWLKSCQEELDKCENILLAMDDDEAGENLRDELSRRLDKARCRIVSYPDGCNDLNDVLTEHGEAKVRECIDSAQPYPIDGLIYLNEIEGKLMKLHEQGFDPGVSTGWDNLDDLYKVKKGQISIVTGVPGNGKSTFVDNLVVNLAKQHSWKFAICSPEHWPPYQHAARMMAKWSQRPFHTEYENRLNNHEVQSLIKDMSNYLYYVTSDSQSDISPDSIIETAQQALFRYGINGLVVDPWNGLSHQVDGGEISPSYISNKLELFRRFARVNECHVWIIAHPRKTGKSVPSMYDISGSATWNDKADCGLSIEKCEGGKMRVHVKKIRLSEVGETGCRKLEFIEGSEHLENNFSY